MKNLESYFEPPFEYINVGKDKITAFFDDHANALKQQSTGIAALEALLAPTNTALSNLKLSLGDTSVNVAEQKSKTLSVDQCIELFVSKAKAFEASVRDKFGKQSAAYQEFYPQGMKPYNKISKATIEALMIQLISAFFNHKTELGSAKCNELQLVYDNYTLARKLQEKKKSQTKGSRLSWGLSFEVMKTQALINLHTIAGIYPGQAEKAKLFFNQSIITPKQHHTADGNTSSQILALPVNGHRLAHISFSPDDVFLVSNYSSDAIYYCSLITATAIPADAELIKIAAGTQAKVTALSLGAPHKKFWYFVNKNTTSSGEVEIKKL